MGWVKAYISTVKANGQQPGHERQIWITISWGCHIPRVALVSIMLIRKVNLPASKAMSVICSSSCVPAHSCKEPFEWYGRSRPHNLLLELHDKLLARRIAVQSTKFLFKCKTFPAAVTFILFRNAENESRRFHITQAASALISYFSRRFFFLFLAAGSRCGEM